MLGQMTYANFKDRYRDKSYIGSGGFAKVYKVYDYANNHFVALKIADVRPELKKFTLQNEVILINQLPIDENIVRYHSCYRFNTGITGEMDFAVLPYYENGNLEQFLKKEEIDSREKRQIIVGILKGINFLHINNIIHRDLKAQNILIHRENGIWIPKIADFGLSRNVLSQDSAVSNSSIGVSFEYASPEQIKNGKIYKNVDLWAVGAIIFRILTGTSPFRKAAETDENNVKSQLEISRRIMALEIPEVFQTIEEPYKSVIAKCLVLDPSERVREARELLTMMGEEARTPMVLSRETAEDKTEIISSNPPIVKPPPIPADHFDKTELINDKTEIVQPQAEVRPQPKQDFQYSPRTKFDMPVYENPRKNVTQIFSAPSMSKEESPPPAKDNRIHMQAADGGFNKLWIYLPLFFLGMTAAVWALYSWLNPSPVVPPVIAPIQPQEEVSRSSIPISFLECFEKRKNDLQGTFKLIPTNEFLNTFEALDHSCLGIICDGLSGLSNDQQAQAKFYRQAKNEDPCLAPLLATSLAYHHQQIKENASMAIFYNSGQSNLSIPQKNELNAFLKKYKRNAGQYGLLIIGRASNVGNLNSNRILSRSRAESIIDFVANHYIRNLKTEFVYFGADPPQLTKLIADDYGIRINKYKNIRYGSGNDQDYALRLNQSVLLVMYAKNNDPFDLENK